MPPPAERLSYHTVWTQTNVCEIICLMAGFPRSTRQSPIACILVGNSLTSKDFRVSMLIISDAQRDLRLSDQSKWCHSLSADGKVEG